MRNYINALVQFPDLDKPVEVIFKVGTIDLEDDMHVFAYLNTEDEIELFKRNGHPEFQIIEYWKGPRPNQETFKFDPDDFDDWMQNTWKYSLEP